MRPAGAPVEGRLREVLSLEKVLVHQVLDSLGVSLSPAQQRSIAPLPTRSFDAFFAFSQGLEYEDRGMAPQAIRAYQRAVHLDPAFAMARERSAVLSVTPADQALLERTMRDQALQPDGLRDRLTSSAAEIGLRGGPVAHDPATTAEAARRVQAIVISVGAR